MADPRPRLRVGWRPATERDAADELLADLVDWHLGGMRLQVRRRCARCGGSGHGRPFVEGDIAHLSLSRAPGLVVAAVSTAGPVGVDVELAGSARFAGFEDVALHPGEDCREPTVTWTRKEALLKATGYGLAVDPRSVWLDDTPQLVSWDEHLATPDRCWIADLPLPRRYVGAVAVIRATGAPAA